MPSSPTCCRRIRRAARASGRPASQEHPEERSEPHRAVAFSGLEPMIAIGAAEIETAGPPHASEIQHHDGPGVEMRSVVELVAAAFLSAIGDRPAHPRLRTEVNTR